MLDFSLEFLASDLYIIVEHFKRTLKFTHLWENWSTRTLIGKKDDDDNHRYYLFSFCTISGTFWASDVCVFK